MVTRGPTAAGRGSTAAYSVAAELRQAPGGTANGELPHGLGCRHSADGRAEQDERH